MVLGQSAAARSPIAEAHFDLKEGTLDCDQQRGAPTLARPLGFKFLNLLHPRCAVLLIYNRRRRRGRDATECFLGWLNVCGAVLDVIFLSFICLASVSRFRNRNPASVNRI
ncbi:MAG: hypothetical protein OXT70_15465 [Chloroflexota bacterium]|nr:hypothetical protein [Chloroflexota bacterium]